MSDPTLPGMPDGPSFDRVVRDLLISSRENLVKAWAPDQPRSEFGFRAFMAAWAGLSAYLLEELRQRDPQHAEHLAQLLDDRLGDPDWIANWVARRLFSLGIDVDNPDMYRGGAAPEGVQPL
jgi:hypothetical protein